LHATYYQKFSSRTKENQLIIGKYAFYSAISSTSQAVANVGLPEKQPSKQITV